jgi:hypothetical protein
VTRPKRARAPQTDQQPAPSAYSPAVGEIPADLDELDPQAVIAELGAEASLVTLYRQDPSAPSRFAYLDSFPADGFSLDAVRNTYGGGNYRLHIRDQGRRVKRQFGFTIDARFKGAAPQPAELPAPLVPAGAAPRAIDPQVAELREGMKALQEVVRTLAAAQTRPQADPMELAVKIAAGFQAAQTAAFQQLQTMQEGNRGGGKGATFSDMRELLLEGIRLGEEKAGAAGPGAGDPMLETVNRLGPPLLNLLDRGLRQEAARGNGHAHPVGAPPPAPAAPPLAAAAAAEPAAVSPPNWQSKVRQQLPALLFMARADVDPEPLAATVAQAMPAEDADQLAQLLAQPDALQQLLAITPELGAYEGWTDRLLIALAQELEVDLVDPAAEPATQPEAEA